MIVIHPNDKTTEFLSVIYDKNNVKLLTEQDSNSKVRREIMSSDDIIMLGHGCNYGLLSRSSYKCFNRLIVNSSHVNFLRNKKCIGIWCNANNFAEKYNLKGLFSGMIISEIEEAYYCNVETSKEELEIENKLFAERLSYCLKHFPLKDVPKEMKNLLTKETPLTSFNYNNLFYYE